MDTLTITVLNVIIFVIGYIIISWLIERFHIINWLDRVGFTLGQYIKKFVHKRDQTPEDLIKKYKKLPVYWNDGLMETWTRLPEYQDGEWTVQYKTNGMYALINNTPHLIKDNQPAYPKINFIYDGQWNVSPGSRQPITQIPNVQYYVGYVYANSVVYNVN